jgi:hypothetical protein
MSDFGRSRKNMKRFIADCTQDPGWAAKRIDLLEAELAKARAEVKRLRDALSVKSLCNAIRKVDADFESTGETGTRNYVRRLRETLGAKND